MPKLKIRSRVHGYERILRTLQQRELGCRSPHGSQYQLATALYPNIIPCNYWDQSGVGCHFMHGGVFNLEFSPDGSLLVAACERKSILMFDPLCRKMIRCVEEAHDDCVNCVRFLDSRTFATCSDDTTVALWDARNLKYKVRTLRGHSNWVKNIEYSRRDGLLVTSGFDGSIYTWDINSYTEEGLVYNRVFHTNGLMRTRLNPDGSKMVICTTGGYLMIIHDLDLATLGQDLAGFKPNMYRLMQLSQTAIPVVAIYTHLFGAKRNRVEFITDFPEGNDAEVISSLQVHPQGWCVLSRNTSGDENSEWTCVHDIQEKPHDKPGPYEDEEDSEDSNCRRGMEDLSSEEPGTSSGRGTNFDSAVDEDLPSSQGTARTSMIFPGVRAQILRPLVQLRFNVPDRSSSSNASSSGAAAVAPTLTPQQDPPRLLSSSSVSSRITNVEVHFASPSVLEALEAIREARVRRQQQRTRERVEEIVPVPATIPSASSSASSSSSSAAESAARTDGRNAFFIRTGSHVGARTVLLLGTNRPSSSGGSASSSSPAASSSARRYAIPPNHRIHQNVPRLLGYVEEPNVGRGFIKELCFNSDGRLVFSPYENGVRILAFNPESAELCACVPEKPTRLHEISRNFCHGNVVVSTKFSPTHCLLVSGCLNGKIVWHQPLFM